MSTETTVTSAEAWRMNVRGFAPQDIIPESLILQTSTIAGQVEGDQPMVLVPFVDDAGASFVPEGDPIPEADPTLAQVGIVTGKIAQLVRVSREQLAQADASQLITGSMRRAVTNAANLAYISQALPTAPAITPPPGLMTLAGTNGGAVATSLDKLVDAIAAIEGAGGTATHILADPTAWASLSKFKSATGSAVTLLGAGVQAGERTLLGLPVLVSAALGAGKLLVVDKSAVVSAVGQIQLAQSDQAYFASDSIGLRVTWRFGANVVKPNRIAKLTVTAPSA